MYNTVLIHTIVATRYNLAVQVLGALVVLYPLGRCKESRTLWSPSFLTTLESSCDGHRTLATEHEGHRCCIKEAREQERKLCAHEQRASRLNTARTHPALGPIRAHMPQFRPTT